MVRTLTRRRLLASGAAVLTGAAISACGRGSSTRDASVETVKVLTGAAFQGEKRRCWWQGRRAGFGKRAWPWRCCQARDRARI